MTNKDAEELVLTASGCLLFIIKFFIIYPMFFIILYQVMNQLELPMWVWVFYWVLVPLKISFDFMAASYKAIRE
jgi:ABC-type multidrug transport system permease subunit